MISKVRLHVCVRSHSLPFVSRMFHFSQDHRTVWKKKHRKNSLLVPGTSITWRCFFWSKKRGRFWTFHWIPLVFYWFRHVLRQRKERQRRLPTRCLLGKRRRTATNFDGIFQMVNVMLSQELRYKETDIVLGYTLIFMPNPNLNWVIAWHDSLNLGDESSQWSEGIITKLGWFILYRLGKPEILSTPKPDFNFCFMRFLSRSLSLGLALIILGSRQFVGQFGQFIGCGSRSKIITPGTHG